MKFKIPADVLNSGLRDVSAAAGKNALRISGHVLLEADKEKGRLRIHSNDLEVMMTASLDAAVTQDGAICLSYPHLSQIAGTLTEEVAIEVGEGDKIKIKSGKARFELRGIAAQEFPKQDLPVGEPAVTIAADLLKSGLGTVMHACLDPGKKAPSSLDWMSAIGFTMTDGALALSCMDGSRMARWSRDSVGAGSFTVTIPRRAGQLMIKLLAAGKGDEAQVFALENGRIGVLVGSRWLASRSMAIPFPDITQYIPQDFTLRATATRKELALALDRALIMAPSTEARIVKLVFGKGKIKVESAAADELGNGADEVTTDYDGERMFIFLNGAYLEDALRGIDYPDLTLCGGGPLLPFMVTSPQEPGAVSVLAPLNKGTEGH